MSSDLIAPIDTSGIIAKLKNPARRQRMFLRMAQDEIAMQLRVLRERRGFHTQVAFAKHAGMQQPAISRVENADYQSWTFQTLLKVANKLDARLRVTFEPVEDVIRRLESVDGVEFDSSASREMTGAPATMSFTVVKETLIEEIEESEDSQFDHFIVQTQDDQWPTQSFSTS